MVDTLFSDDDTDHLIWKWKPVTGDGEREPDERHDVAVLGVGMHPWGKWGRNFVEYGVAAARDALRDAGIAWTDVQFVSGADTMRNGYPGYVAGRHVRPGPRLDRRPRGVVATPPAPRASPPSRPPAPASSPGCATSPSWSAPTPRPKGFLAPNAGDRPDDPDWLRFRLLGATNPTYFALYARRRMDLYGATDEDFAKVKVKNARHGLANPNARYRKEVTVDEVLASPDGGRPAAPARDLRHLRRRRRRRARLRWTSPGATPTTDPVRVAAVSTVTPTYPNTIIDLPDIATDSSAVAAPPERPFKASIAHAAYEEAGIGPEDLSLAEVYDLSTALELDWYEDIGLCKAGRGRAAAARRRHRRSAGRIPVNPSGGLACFGEAVPAQAIAQVCEVTWQLRGQAAGRQVEGATVGITANQGLFGHGSSVLLTPLTTSGIGRHRRAPG